jgi:hypothetical protein
MAVLTSSAFGLLVAPTPSSGAVVPKNTVILYGNGVDSIRFGHPEASALASLEKLEGSPLARLPTPLHGGGIEGCGIDVWYQFENFIAYFQSEKFVGYAATPKWNDNSAQLVDIFNGQTTQGLRVGSSAALAEKLYSSAFSENGTQGGVFTVTLSSGEIGGFLDGYGYDGGKSGLQLSASIRTIEAGHVGYAAMSPFDDSPGFLRNNI